jgi:hypothetical protein
VTSIVSDASHCGRPHAGFSAHLPALYVIYANTLEGAQGGTRDKRKVYSRVMGFFSESTQD